MKNRCLNKKNHAYFNYGGRGIIICDRWINDYDAFYEDMGERKKGQSLDRIDTNGNYELNNCRWATMKEQQNNRNDNIFVTYKNETLSISCWAEKLGIKKSTLFRRLNIAKMPIEIAFSMKLTSPEMGRRSGWKELTTHEKSNKKEIQKKINKQIKMDKYQKKIKTPIKTNLFVAGDRLMFK